MQNAIAIQSKPSRGHRFRASILRRKPFGRRISADLPPVEKQGDQKARWSFTQQDAKDFLMAYSACFLAVMGLIA